MRPLQAAPQVNALIATIGLWMIFHHGAGWIWGYDPVRFPSLFSSDPLNVLGTRVAQNSLGIIGVSLLVWCCSISSLSTRAPALRCAPPA